jgi:hypothetical protein
VRIAEDIKQFQPLKLLKDINEQVLWPPLHSFIQVPFQFAFGSSFYANSICSLAFLPIFFVTLTFFYHQLADDWFGFLVLVGFAATSPFYAAYSSMPMLEIFGAALTALSGALYLKKSKLFPLSLAFLFFLKYNYCIYVLLAVAVDQIIAHWRVRSEELRAIVIPRTPFRIFVLFYLLFLLFIVVTGGFEIGKLHVRGIGNPLYILLWILVIRSLLLGQHKKVWRRISGTGWEWFMIPVLIWLLIPIPNRVRTIVSFAINAPLNGHTPWELSYYTFYFQALHVYFVNQWSAWFVLVIALAVWILYRKKWGILFSGLLFVLPFLLMTFNQNKQDRFLFTFVFVLWVLVAYGISRWSRIWIRLACVLFFFGILYYFYNPSLTKDTITWPFVPKEVQAPIKFIVEQTKNAREIRVLGAENQMSPSLIAYHIRKANQFKNDPRFSWSLKKPWRPGTIIVCINQPPPGPISAERFFPGGIKIDVMNVDRAGN